MIKIWEKYFYKELLKTTCLFLLIFYCLYALIDYSSHLSGTHYHHSKLSFYELLIHYGWEFSSRAEILLPFGLLIATVKTLTQLNSRRELVALLAGGYSLYRLLIPYLFVALFGVMLLYANNEWLVPKSVSQLNYLSEKHAHQKRKINQQLKANHLKLQDGSLLIYGVFNPASNKFHDVYWISSQEIWHINELNPFASPPTGTGIDCFDRKNACLTYQTSHQEKEIASMKFNNQHLHATLRTPDQLSFSELFIETSTGDEESQSEKGARRLTALYRKLTLPWLAFLAVIGPAPFCLRFSRNSYVFFIFAGAIFGLVTIYLILNAATVLSERQIINPKTAFLGPMSAFMAVFLYRFIRMRT